MGMESDMSFRQDCRMVRIYKKGTRVHEMWAGARARPIFWGGVQGLRMKKSEDLESEIGIKGCAAALAT
jgi:hypothetical protein